VDPELVGASSSACPLVDERDIGPRQEALAVARSYHRGEPVGDHRQASGISRPKASSVMASGSGPPRRPVSSASIAAISSAVSSRSKTSMFSAMRLGLVDFGDDRAHVLYPPAEHDLGGGLAAPRGDAADHRVLEGAGVVAIAVERDAADR
jgi:hypothetical protein